MKKILNFIKNKFIKNTLMTLLLVIIIVGIGVGLNLLANHFDLTSLDVTSKKVNSLSDETKNKLSNLDKDVEICIFGLSDNENIMNITKRYHDINEKIVITEVKDVSLRPDLVAFYGLKEDTQAIVVVSGEQSKLLSTNDLSSYDYTTYEQIDLTEEAVTNAIIDVTLENKPKVYFLTGHNKYNITSHLGSVTAYLQNEANEIDELDLMTVGSIPEDCNVLVITTLTSDFTALEKDAIMDYINKGGNIMILADPNYSNVDLTNFNTILDTYGVEIVKGILFEGDSSKMVMKSPDLVIPTVSAESDITKYINSDGGVCFMDSGILKIKDDAEENGLTVTQLANASESAYLRTDFENTAMSKVSGDEDAANATLGALVEKTIDGELKSKLVIYANQIFSTDMPLQISDSYSMHAVQLYNNLDLVLNSVSYLAQRKDTLVIRKDAGTITYTATELENNVIKAIIYVVPLLIIIAGIIVWQVRRRKK